MVSSADGHLVGFDEQYVHQVALDGDRPVFFGSGGDFELCLRPVLQIAVLRDMEAFDVVCQLFVNIDQRWRDGECLRGRKTPARAPVLHRDTGLAPKSTTLTLPNSVALKALNTSSAGG